MHTTTDNPADITNGTAPVADAAEPDCTQPAACGRRWIAVSDLAAHPGNVRGDLHLTEEFLASIRAEGVRIPLLITTTAGGTWRGVEGPRPLPAAVQAGPARGHGDHSPTPAGGSAATS